MTTDDGEKPPKQFTSFGFSKKLPAKKLTDSSIRDASTKAEDESKDYVLQVDKVKGIDSTKPKETVKELIIPCEGNKYKFDETYNNKSDKKLAKREHSPEKELDEAAKELIQESKDWEQQQEGNDEDHNKNANLTIRVDQDTEEALFKKDVESKAKQSTLDDYDSIPVQGFGMGMLRGMGFKKDEGVGGFKKAVVNCIEAAVRPKGLGLGAAVPKKKDARPNTSNDNKEKLELVKGAYVYIEKGTRLDKDIDKYGTRYGQVDGMDEESARVMVKMALGGGAILSISENIVRVVSKSEYKEYAKVVNKDQYNDHVKRKRDQEESHDLERSEKRRDASRDDRYDDRSQNKNDRERSGKSDKYESYRRKDRSRSPIHDRNDRDKRDNGYHTNTREIAWLRPQIKVRIIDKYYKNGRYYKRKAVVEDVIDPYTCVCRTIDSEKSKILENIPSSYLETVIPSENGIVMVLLGKYKGQLGEILMRDKHKARANIQLINDKEVVRLDFDQLCEFMGDIDMY